MTRRKELETATDEAFDPLRYIEQSFVDTPKTARSSEDDLEIPSISEFLSHTEPKPKTPKKVRKEPSTKLSAPRPRKASKKKAKEAPPVELEETWASLQKNLSALSHFFDDAVTANYYRGEFKESRLELMQRILDPELNLEEVSRLLGVCPATVRRYTNRGWLDHHRTQGGQRRFKLSGLVRFIEEHNIVKGR